MTVHLEAARLAWHDLGKTVQVVQNRRVYSGVLLNIEHVTNGTEIMISVKPDYPDTVFIQAGWTVKITGKAS